MPKRRSSKLALGIDLGGTKIEAAIAEALPGGEVAIATRERIATPRDDGYEAILTAAAGLVVEVARRERLDLDVVPIGVGMPGSVDRRGYIKNSNTTCLNGRPFRMDLIRRVGVPIQFDNDANCFALAEAVGGAARPFSRGLVLGLILGTGVGAGWVHQGRVWSGRHAIAGEWGHHAVIWPSGRPCYCGGSGCVEAYLSGPAAEADYQRRSGTARGLREIASRQGIDADARGTFEELCDVFGRALANVIDIVDPDAIVLGGGLSNLDLWYEQGRAAVERRVFNDELTTPFLRPELGDSAGVLGAALLTGWHLDLR